MSDLSRADRKKVAESYVDLASLFGREKSLMKVEIEAYRYENCGLRFLVYGCKKCLLNYRMVSSCNSRICERCGNRLRKSIFHRFYELIKPFWNDRAKTYGAKFVTLSFTTKRWDGDYPTQADFKRCQNEVREFVKRFYHKHYAKKSRNGGYYLSNKWRGCGAICVPELGKGCNLHFHLLVYGPHIKQKTLSAAWKEITGDSFGVFIKKADNPKKAVSYILKYITKPPQSDSPFDIAAWAWLLKGSRRLVTYGTLYNKLPVKVQRPDRMKLLCVFDGGKLEFRGESADTFNYLIDWQRYLKYIEDTANPNLKTYLLKTPYGQKNINFKMY